jgi:hypothetical protein
VAAKIGAGGEVAGSIGSKHEDALQVTQKSTAAAGSIGSPCADVSFDIISLNAIKREIIRIEKLNRSAALSEVIQCSTNWIIKHSSDLDPDGSDHGPGMIRNAYRRVLAEPEAASSSDLNVSSCEDKLTITLFRMRPIGDPYEVQMVTCTIAVGNGADVPVYDSIAIAAAIGAFRASADRVGAVGDRVDAQSGWSW